MSADAPGAMPSVRGERECSDGQTADIVTDPCLWTDPGGGSFPRQYPRATVIAVSIGMGSPATSSLSGISDVTPSPARTWPWSQPSDGSPSSSSGSTRLSSSSPRFNSTLDGGPDVSFRWMIGSRWSFASASSRSAESGSCSARAWKPGWRELHQVDEEAGHLLDDLVGRRRSLRQADVAQGAPAQLELLVELRRVTRRPAASTPPCGWRPRPRRRRAARGSGRRTPPTPSVCRWQSRAARRGRLPSPVGRVLRPRRGERQRRHRRRRREEPGQREVEAPGEGGDLADVEVALALAVEGLLDRRHAGLLQLVAEVRRQLVAGLVLRPALVLAGAPEVVGDHLVDADRFDLGFRLRIVVGP